MQANEVLQGPSRDRRRHAPWEEVPAGASAGATPAWGRSRDDWRSGVLSHRERRPPLTLDESGRLRPADDDAWLQFSRQLTRWLDSSFQVPGTRLRFGWEPVIGLVPGLDRVLPAPLNHEGGVRGVADFVAGHRIGGGDAHARASLGR